MRYRYFVDFRHGISVFANFSCGIAVLGTAPPPSSMSPSWNSSEIFGGAPVMTSELLENVSVIIVNLRSLSGDQVYFDHLRNTSDDRR